jgi:phosphatidylinositol alpha-1,6-mannosyltransferase
LIYDLLGVARTQALAPRPRRAPYAVALYGIEVWRPLGWAHRRALHGAAVLAAISQHTIDRARPHTGALTRARLLPLTLEQAPEIDAAPDDLGEGFVLIVGRMAASERYKGHDVLLDALPSIVRELPHVRLVVAGDGDDRARIERRARDLGVASHVAFTGYVDPGRLRSLYRRAAVFAMPSQGEGFGLVYLEAMREGIPCVAARGSAAEEILVDGETGLLVDPTSPEAVAHALLRLLGERELRRRLGAAGKARYETVFSAARFREHLDAILDELREHVRH